MTYFYNDNRDKKKYLQLAIYMADRVGSGFFTSAMLHISSTLFVNQSNLQFFISFVLEKQFFSFCSEV